MEVKDKDGGMLLRPPSNFFFLFRRLILKGGIGRFCPPSISNKIYILFP